MLVPRLSLPELARRYLAKEPHALEPEERNALESFKARRPIRWRRLVAASTSS